MPSAQPQLALLVLLAASTLAAQDRGRSAKQRFVVRVPQKVSFGSLPPVSNSAADPAVAADTPAVRFFTETTAGVTIRFEAESTAAPRPALQLDVIGNQAGTWRAVAVDGATGPVQVSSSGAGWAMLQLHTPATTDGVPPTVIITIVAH